MQSSMRVNIKITGDIKKAPSYCEGALKSSTLNILITVAQVNRNPVKQTHNRT
jgi:hypothetical protein